MPMQVQSLEETSRGELESCRSQQQGGKWAQRSGDRCAGVQKRAKVGWVDHFRPFSDSCGGLETTFAIG